MDRDVIGNCNFGNIVMNFSGLENMEIELKKRCQYPYKWYRKQNDQWDRYSKFIYKINSWETLVDRIATVVDEENIDGQQFFQYASIRWFNFWSAKAVEGIFAKNDYIEPVADEFDNEKDFYLFQIPFDHKTSVFPLQFQKSFDYAQNHKKELIEWLYRNQSSQQRHHLKNRLFIVVHNKNGEHWKLKAELSMIQKIIMEYLSSFDPKQLYPIEFSNGQRALSDVIWVSK